MFLSIIIPAFNVQGFIKECIESIPASKLYDIEIIVIDDGSTDNTVNEVLAIRDPRVQLHSFSNGGLSVARNRGIELASGKYVFFLDSDDSINSAELHKALKLLFDHDLDCLLFGAESYFDDTYSGNEALVDKSRYERRSNYINQVVDSKLLFNDFIFHRKYIVSACMYIVKLDYISELRFEEGMFYEDNIFTTKMLLKKNGRFMSILSPLYRRRVRSDSITTSTIAEKNVGDMLLCYDNLMMYCNSEVSSCCKSSLSIFLLSILKNASDLLNSKNNLSFTSSVRYRTRFLLRLLTRPFQGGKAKFFIVLLSVFGVKV